MKQNRANPLADRDPIRTVLSMQRETVRRDDPIGGRGGDARTEPSLSTEAIDEHGNDRGLCPACGSAFPCDRAVLADLALSAL